MAKTLLLNVLLKILGEYIELNEENLSLGVWSGQILLSNLNLKTEKILHDFNLDVKHGIIQKLEVNIPWATLLHNPIRILISGILLDVGPLDITKMNKTELLKRYLTEKYQKLKMIDQYFELSYKLDADKLSSSAIDQNDVASSESYLQQWVTKIVDNIEITLSNMHIRYEDDLSIPGNIFAGGITLESFGIATNNDKLNNNNNTATTNPNNNSTSSNYLNKIAYIKGLGIYWQDDLQSQQTMAQLPLKIWEKEMLEFMSKSAGIAEKRYNIEKNKLNHSNSTIHKNNNIDSTNNNTHDSIHITHILSPYNSNLTLRMKHYKKPNSDVPKYDIHAVSGKLRSNIDSMQYAQLIHVMDRMAAFDRLREPLSYRPKNRPSNSVTCKAWWKYAGKLALKMKRYIKLMKLARTLAAGNDDPIAYLSPSSALIVRELEIKLPFECLSIGRQQAIVELYEESKLKENSKQSKGGGWSWGGWLTGGGGDSVPITNDIDTIETNTDISIESILGELNRRDTSVNGSSGMNSKGNITLVRFSLESSASLLLSTKNKPILQSSAALCVSFLQTSATLKVSCHLKDLYVRDEYTVNPPLPYLISVKSDVNPILRRSKSPIPHNLNLDSMKSNENNDTKPTFSMIYETESSSGKSKLSMASLPIELVLNKDCIQMLINSFERPENSYKVKIRSKSINPSKTNSRNNLQNNNQTLKNNQETFGLRSKNVIFNQIISNNQKSYNVLEISLEAYAPKIIIPEYNLGDEGYLLIDCGFLVMSGFSSSVGISIDWSLQEVCVGMPLKIRDMYTFGEKALYLIKPFDIIMQMQNIEQVLANITMNVEIKPEIRGEIDSLKLARLLRALGQVSQMFAKMPSSVPAVQTLLDEVMNEIIASTTTNITTTMPAAYVEHQHISRVVSPVESDINQDLFRNVASTTKDYSNIETPFHNIPSNRASPLNSTDFFSPIKDTIEINPIDFFTPNTSIQDLESNDVNKKSSYTYHNNNSSSNNNISNKSPEQLINDPYLTTLKIDLVLPVVALDLTYNVVNGYHLVLEINAMRATYSTRLYDKNITFELGEICMQDSFRSKDQRYLMWTPQDCGSLVHISYVNVNSKQSPLYKEHATYIIANFSFLNLNVDVNTINHLRPFFEVLLTPTANDNIVENQNNINNSNNSLEEFNKSSNNNIASYPSGSNLLSKDIPEGMHLVATLERISIDLLRAPHQKHERKGGQLESAFSAQISGMCLELFTLNLMKATVCLQSFEIFDIRNGSQDYAFQKVFCPQMHDNIIVSSSIVSSLSSNQLNQLTYVTKVDSNNSTDESFYDTSAGDSSKPKKSIVSENIINLLEITYTQESKVHSLIELVISDITSFIAVDTMLDFSNIFMINFFALLGLLATPSFVTNLTTNNNNNITSPNVATKKQNNSEQPVYFTTAEKDTGKSNKTIKNILKSDSFDKYKNHDESFEQLKEITSTMNVAVKIVNPKLIFLEDPTTLETKAVCGTCGVGMQYTRVSKTYLSSNGIVVLNKTSLIESLHITVSKYEVFVIQNMSRWIPQPILEPMEIELHLKKRTEDGVTKILSLHIEIDNFNAQVSFNDILLAQSIISRRVLIESTSNNTTTTPVPSPDQPPPSQQGISDRNETDTIVANNNNQTDATITFQFGLNTLQVIIINDFNSKNVPILKANVKNSHFYFEEHTLSSYVIGNGIFSAQIDFFNPHLSMWEPLLEVWQPSAKIYSIPETNTKIFEIKSDCTLQITISGILLETLLKSYSIFFHDSTNDDDNEKRNKERAGMSDMEAHNLLGNDVGIELFHCVTKKKIITLLGGESGIINSTASNGIYRRLNTLEDLPSSVDVYFLGELQRERLPLIHVPLNTNKPKAYNLQPLSSDSLQPNQDVVAIITSNDNNNDTNLQTHSQLRRGNKKYVIEPIVEEVYENARYDPITGWWRQPFFLGDPPEWTDGSGTIRKDINSIQIAATDQWEWQGKWEVDLDGVIGVEIDHEGWEYATSFNMFTMVSTRRTVQSMDSVRRRRWTRTRVPKASCTSQIERPLTLFWDVQVLNNGSRKLNIRSALQISNKLAFPILISLHHNAWQHEINFGPIEVDGVLSIPLLYSYAHQVCFRPDFPCYHWSSAFACSSQSYDFRSIKHASCKGTKDDESTGNSTSNTNSDVKPIWFKVITTQTNKSVLVTLKSCIVITNKLLCDMQFICLTNKIKTEEGKIDSGTKMKLSHIDLSKNPQLVIKVGLLKWSNPIPINTMKNEADVFELTRPGNKKAIKLYLSMNSKINTKSGATIEIDIFSKAAVIDRTGLHLYIASKLNPGVGLVRSTCSSLLIQSSGTSKDLKTTSHATAQKPSFVSSSSKQQNSISSESSQEVHTTPLNDIVIAVPTTITTTAAASVNPLKKSSEQIVRSSSSKRLMNIISPITSYSSSQNAYTNSMTIDNSTTPSTSTTTKTNLNTLFDTEANRKPESSSTDSELLIHSVAVNSQNKYELCYSNLGEDAYTRNNNHLNNLSELKWCYLPACFQKQLQLRTPMEDKLQRSNRLIKFITSTSCMVFIFIDIRALQLKWLKDDGYIKIMEIAAARGLFKNTMEEYHYAIYGKFYEPNAKVILKASWNKQAANMYTVFILSTKIKVMKDIEINENQSIKNSTDEEEVEDSDLISKDMIYKQLSFQDTYSRDISARSWTEGANQLTLLYTYDNVITVGLCRGKVWSEEIDIDIQKNTSSTGSFEVPHNETQICYQLSYKLQPLPGLYSETQLITFIPRYCILNCTEEVLLLSQRGSEKYLQYQPYQPEGWHKLEMYSDTEVQLRTTSSMWSLGAIDINEIGSSVLYLPYRREANESIKEGKNGIVIHVEVKLADASDQCNIIVIVWEEVIEFHNAVSISVCNHSDVPVTIRQADIEVEHDITGQEHLFEITVPSGCSIPFGWSDPAVSSEILVSVGVGLQGINKRIASINMLKTDQLLRLPYQTNTSSTTINSSSGGKAIVSRGEVVLATKMSNHGHTLEITNMSKFNFTANSKDHETNRNGSSSSYKELELNALKHMNSHVPSYGFDFLLSSFGISLVVEKPTRREFLSLYVDLFEILYRIRGNMRSVEVMVMDLQIDNYSETVIYPVLLRSRKKQIHQSVAFENDHIKTTSESKLLDHSMKSHYSVNSTNTSTKSYDDKPEVPFIKFTIVQEKQTNGLPPVFKYVAFRVLSLAIEVDSSTVYLFFEDLLNGLKILNQSQALAISFPDHWLDEFNRNQLYPQQQLKLTNVYQSKIQAQQSKLYFQNLIIHPIKVTFTLTQTTYPRNKRKKVLHSTILNQLERLSLVGIEKLQIKLRSFEVEDAMESITSLLAIILNQTKSELQSQLAQIAGSITMIGSPIGFVRKVGSGVKAFFYEPYLGSVHSSQEFVMGLGRGTSSLFSSVVTGAMDSTAAIVGTATKGMSYISGDNEYVRKRAAKRQERLANRGGFLEGIRDGTDSLLSGISSGVTGLISKPIEEASKSGIQGFFKGLGLGIIGVAVKPMIGFSDGITSVAQGISNAVDINMKSSHVRPPRALQPSILDPSSLVIVPLNMDAAFAQEFVINRAKRGHYEDSFLCYIPLEIDGEAIILSNVYVYWRRSQSLWGRVWANISHCIYMNESNSIGIMLYSGGNHGGACLVAIPCITKHTAKKVYQALVANKTRMGNPANVISLDVLDSLYNNSNNCFHSNNHIDVKNPTSQPSVYHNTIMSFNNQLLLTNQTVNSNISQQDNILRNIKDVSLLGTIDGYHFGNANGQILKRITGSEFDVLKRAQYNLEKSILSWEHLDQNIWQLLWEWNCINPNCRCCVTVVTNRSDSPIQITRVQMVVGRNAQIFGSIHTGYEVESRSLLPDGAIIVFISAFPESSLLIDTNHLKANINTAAFSAVLASTQRESFCEAKGGFTVGFLEKSVTDWWCKYVIIVS